MISTQHPAVTRLLVLAALAGGALAASAAPLTAEQRLQVVDMHRRADLGPHAAPLRRDSGSQPAGPKLIAWTIGASVDATVSDAQLRVDLTAVDKAAGLTYVSVFATSPDGQSQVMSTHSVGFPAAKVSPVIGLSFNAYQAPGTWTIQEVLLIDAVGNQIAYSTADLTNFGPTTFTVLNDSFHLDRAFPTVSAGKVLTPRVDVHAGFAFAGVQYVAKDTGSPVVSGIAETEAQFCTLDFANCMILSQSQTYAGIPKVTMTPGLMLSPGYPAGTYYLALLNTRDWAGQILYLWATEFGGSTDFSVMFPEGHIITVVD